MTDEQYLQLARRLGGLEQAALRPRIAVVDSVAPLTVRVAGGDAAVGAQQIDGAALEPGMNVFVVTWTGGLVVVGPIGATAEWRRIGASGVPAFTAGFAHREGDTGDGFEWAEFRKTALGEVQFRGMVNATTDHTVGTILFTLPAGYRPARRRLLHVLASDGINRIDVLPSGDVRIDPNLYAGMWLSLEQLSFSAD